ncbi:MAG: hypothetical protein GXO78_13540 [Calditrichaeota bacterium]|nr:hypothetical protein [Calditrichota bacterium]
MIDIQQLQQRIRRFVRRIRNTWQIYFFLTVILYGTAAVHYFRVRPGLKSTAAATFTLLENVAIFLAFALLMGIFLIKRQFFSRRYQRQLLEQAMKSSADDEIDALNQLLQIIEPRFTWIWTLAFLVVADGVLFYWLTFSPQYLHMLFIVGLFSLFINYPREELFTELPWQVEQIKMDLAHQKQDRGT